MLQVIALKESIQVDNLVSSSISSDVAPHPPKPVKEMPESFRLAAPLSEGELTTLLLSSPLYQKLDAVKNLIQGGAGKGGVFQTPCKYKVFLKVHATSVSEHVFYMSKSRDHFKCFFELLSRYLTLYQLFFLHPFAHFVALFQKNLDDSQKDCHQLKFKF